MVQSFVIIPESKKEVKAVILSCNNKGALMKKKESDISKIIAAEQNLRILINNTDDPLWLVDTHCVILDCNPSFKNWVAHFIGKELSPGANVLDSSLNRLYLEKFEMCYQLALN